VGGETPLLDSTEMYSRMCHCHPEFMEAVERFGVKYVRYLPEYDDPTSAIGRGWKSTFLCATQAEAEASLLKLGSSWEWLPDMTLKTVTAKMPGVRADTGPHRTNRKAFYNSIVAAFTGWNDSRNVGEKAVVLDNGEDTLLDATIIRHAGEIMQEISVAVTWEAGDVFILDNRTVMHSRNPFEGPRRILAGLARDPYR
jgi:hypothetical protein